MISKYMKELVDKLVDVDFGFVDSTVSPAAERELILFEERMCKDSKASSIAALSLINKALLYTGDEQPTTETDLYHCPGAEDIIYSGLFESKKCYDAYGTNDIEIAGKLIRLLNNYGDEDGTYQRVGDNYAWYSPCIMYAVNRKLVFELVDLAVPRIEFGRHRPFIYRHAKANTDIPASFWGDVGFGKRAFFYGENWLLEESSEKEVFSIRHDLEPKQVEKLELRLTGKTDNIKVAGINLCVSDNMLIIPATEVEIYGHK